MKVQINCACNATFEIRNGSRHPKSIICPNCGRELPNGASQDLFNALHSFETFEAKLDDAERYEIFISK